MTNPTAVLLDTHTLLWALVDPGRLSPSAIEAMTTAQSRLVSVATCWELAIKHQSGKLPAAAALLEDWDDTVARVLGSQLGLQPPDAISAARLPWPHKDPFDRMLAAQAVRANAVLLTKDSAFDSLRWPGFSAIW
ncbi:MAG: type II toxin-antitoxin system VapC family toxin [Propionibacteriaceae bacterium]|nr:type II toxin-antitoxin system VapC family toxin [Propionibacteriaceae bacterium]